MPRANRLYLPGHVWHLTHRCHQRKFLLRFARDRRRWRYWLFEARKRYGLCVLNYVATSNHVHLLVLDRGHGEIARSMQLVAGRTAQEYNHRKQRRGAWWEDRYHATAVDSDHYLAKCLVYIDLNMVRAGVVSHPVEWQVCGYRELQQPPVRYRILDWNALMRLLGIRDPMTLQNTRAAWVDEALRAESLQRDGAWTESLAVGSQAFVRGFQVSSGLRAGHRLIVHERDRYQLREDAARYACQFPSQMTSPSGDKGVNLDE
jgi:putative transposase